VTAPKRAGAEAVLEIAFIALFLAATGYQLFIPPIVGLADNGDYARVMHPFGLDHRAEGRERYFLYLQREYAFVSDKGRAPLHWSSAQLVALPAVLAAKGFSRENVLDIRLIGAANLSLVVVGVWLLLRATRPLPFSARCVAGAALLLIYTDVVYVAPLNSMYTQPASVAFILCAAGAAACMLAEGVTFGRLIGLTLAAILFVLSKPQESVQAIPLAFCIGALGWKGGIRWWRTLPLIAALVFAGAMIYRHGTPATLRRVAVYQAIYTEILAHSPDPAADLDFFQLPRWTVIYRGTDGFSPGSGYSDPRLDSAHFDRIGFRGVAAFYLTHPARAWQTLGRTLRASFTMRPRFGNFEKDAAKRYGYIRSRAFAFWSGMREPLGDYPRLTASWFSAAVLIMIAWNARRPETARWAAAGLLLLFAMAALEFAVCGLLNAHYELTRVLLTFHAMTDLVFIALITWIALLAGRTLWPRFAARRREAALTQSGTPAATRSGSARSGSGWRVLSTVALRTSSSVGRRSATTRKL
jgi:hypothetical protein